MAIPWFLVLDHTREIARGREKKDPKKAVFAAEELAKKTGLPDNVASAWLGKFCRWGYVVRVGKAPSKGRFRTLYSLTTWGIEFVRKKKGSVSTKLKKSQIEGASSSE